MLSSQRVRSIMRCSDIESLRTHDFPGVLKERVPGTPGHEEVRKVRSYLMRSCTLLQLIN